MHFLVFVSLNVNESFTIFEIYEFPIIHHASASRHTKSALLLRKADSVVLTLWISTEK